jgi:hypothetical protein
MTQEDLNKAKQVLAETRKSRPDELIAELERQVAEAERLSHEAKTEAERVRRRLRAAHAA